MRMRCSIFGLVLIAGVGCHRQPPAPVSAPSQSAPPAARMPTDSGAVRVAQQDPLPDWAEDISWRIPETGDVITGRLARRMARGYAAMPLLLLEATLEDLEKGSKPSPSPALLQRAPERYRGEGGIYEGRVIDIRETPTNGTAIQLGAGKEGTDSMMVFAFVPPADDVVSGARIRVFGFADGEYRYTSRAGIPMSMPKIVAAAIVPPSAPRNVLRTRAREIREMRAQFEAKAKDGGVSL